MPLRIRPRPTNGTLVGQWPGDVDHGLDALGDGCFVVGPLRLGEFLGRGDHPGSQGVAQADRRTGPLPDAAEGGQEGGPLDPVEHDQGGAAVAA
jgi:hypothetical protein